MGGADGVSGNAHARDSSLHFVPLRMTKRGAQCAPLWVQPAKG